MEKGTLECVNRFYLQIVFIYRKNARLMSNNLAPVPRDYFVWTERRQLNLGYITIHITNRLYYTSIYRFSPWVRLKVPTGINPPFWTTCTLGRIKIFTSIHAQNLS